MIRSVLRLLVVLSVLAFPAMASQKASPLVMDVPQTRSFVLADVPANDCLMPPSFCALCLACSAVTPDGRNVLEIAQRAEPLVASVDALVGVLSVPRPVPP